MHTFLMDYGVEVMGLLIDLGALKCERRQGIKDSSRLLT